MQYVRCVKAESTVHSPLNIYWTNRHADLQMEKHYRKGFVQGTFKFF